MVRNAMIFMAALGLAACSDNGGFSPITGDRFGEDDGAEDGSIPPGQVDSGSALANNANYCEAAASACSGDLILVRFDTETPESLFIRGLPFDDDVLDAVYRGGNVAILGPGEFEDFQPDTVTNESGTDLSNQYIALFARNDNVSAGAVKVASYGDFGYGGAFYSVNTPVEAVPESETLAIYKGDYAGLRAFIGQAGLNVVQGTVELRLDNNTSGDAEPTVKGFIQRTSVGTVLLAPDRDDQLVNDPTVAGRLDRIILNDAPLVDGTFAGTAEVLLDDNDDGAAEPVMTGTYQGTFGGADAASAAGIVQLNGNLTQDTGPDLTGIVAEETGAFIADRED